MPNHIKLFITLAAHNTTITMMHLMMKLKKAGNILKRGGQRIYTAIAYLNDVEEGGATEFRDLNISVKPKKGSILVWKNVLPGTTKVHPLSLHAGRPVTGGEKYAFNLWFRENKFV